MKIQIPHLPAQPYRVTSLERYELNQGIQVVSQTFQNEDFTHIRMDGVIFRQCVFENVDFSDCDWMDCLFERCSFIQCKCENGSLRRVVFDSCRQSGMSFYQSSGKDVYWKECLLQYADFSQCALKVTRFEHCIATGASFYHVSLVQCDFKNNDLSNCDFAETSLREIHLASNNIQQARLSIPLLKGACVSISQAMAIVRSQGILVVEDEYGQK